MMENRVIFVDFQKKKKLDHDSVVTIEKNDIKENKKTSHTYENEKQNSNMCDILNLEEYIDMSVKNAYASLLMSLEEDGWNSEHSRILEYVNEQIEELKYVLKIILKLEKHNKK